MNWRRVVKMRGLPELTVDVGPAIPMLARNRLRGHEPQQDLLRDGPEADFGPASLKVHPGPNFPFACHSSRLTEGTGALSIVKCEMAISRRLTPTESNSNRQNALRFNGPGEYPSLGLSFLSSVSFPHVQYMPT